MQKKKTLLLREVSAMWICVTREMCCQGVCQCIWIVCLPPSLHLDIGGLSHKCYSHPKNFQNFPINAPVSTIKSLKCKCNTELNNLDILNVYLLYLCYSVELDFKLQEDKLQPLMKRLCPLDSQQSPALPYSNEVFTTTPKRKSKTESKKHARWKLWFLWIKHEDFGNSLFSGYMNAPVLHKMDEAVLGGSDQHMRMDNR